MGEKQTFSNQKVVKVEKELCNKEHLYATINLDAMSAAACNLDAGAFKLWCYFAKNQNGYEFALSSKAVERDFGIKIKQYNNAVAELIDKGYLVNTKGNNYIFNEISLITKKDKGVITKEDNPVITKKDKGLLPLELRNIIDSTNNNTKEILQEKETPVEGSRENPIIVSREWLVARSNNLIKQTNGDFLLWNKYYRLGG